MRGLQATYFIFDELVKFFSLLEYGVGIILAVVCFKRSCERLLRGRAQLRKAPGNGISDSLCLALVLLPTIFGFSWSTSAASVRRQRSKLYYQGSGSTPVVTASKAALRAGRRQTQSLHQDYCSDRCAQAATWTTSRSTAAVMQQRLRSERPSARRAAAAGSTCEVPPGHLWYRHPGALVPTSTCACLRKSGLRSQRKGPVEGFLWVLPQRCSTTQRCSLSRTANGCCQIFSRRQMRLLAVLRLSDLPETSCSSFTMTSDLAKAKPLWRPHDVRPHKERAALRSTSCCRFLKEM